jgi:hypothetical protein
MTTKKKPSQSSFIFVTATEIDAVSMSAAIKAARKQGITGEVAVVEIDHKGEPKGGRIDEDFGAVIASVLI